MTTLPRARVARLACLCLVACLVGAAAYAQGKGPNETLRLLSVVKTTKGFDPGKAVSEAQIRQILAAGVNAPSAMNKQPWFFSAILNADLRSEMREAANKFMRTLMKSGAPGGASGTPKAGPADKPPAGGPGARDPLDNAPAAILISGTKEWRWSAIDCSLACESMAIAAQSLGLGTHIVAAPVDALKGPDEAALRKKLGISTDKEPILLLLIGYPANPVDSVSKASTRVTDNFTILK